MDSFIFKDEDTFLKIVLHFANKGQNEVRNFKFTFFGKERFDFPNQPLNFLDVSVWSNSNDIF